MTSASKTVAKCDVETWQSLWTRPNWRRAAARLEKERASIRWRRFRAELDGAFGDRTLDCVELGSGEGDASILLAELGHRVTLVDFSSAALDCARERFERRGLAGRAMFVQADLFQFARDRAGSFDVSVSLGVAEHFRMEQRRRIVAAHRRVLRPGGVTMISVPNAHCLPYLLWMFHARVRRWWKWGYEQPYSRRGLAGLGRSAGLTDCRVYKSGFNAALGSLTRIVGLARDGDRDGPGWVNRLQGWDLNLLGRAG